MAVGVLVAIGGLGGVVGAALAHRLVRAVGSARALVLLEGGAGPCALLPLADEGRRIALFALGSAAVGGGVVAGNVVSTSSRQAYVPPELLGRVMAAMQVADLGTIPLGAVVAGTLAEALGTRSALAVLTAGYALSGLVLALGPLRGRRDLPQRGPALTPR